MKCIDELVVCRFGLHSTAVGSVSFTVTEQPCSLVRVHLQLHWQMHWAEQQDRTI